MDSQFINLINIRKSPIFQKNTCPLGTANGSTTFHLAICCWPKFGANKMNVAGSPSTIFSTCITLLFGTETAGPRCQKEGSLKATNETPKLIGEDMPALGSWKWSSEECSNFNSIKSVNNDAHELKTKNLALWNNQVRWAAQ